MLLFNTPPHWVVRPSWTTKKVVAVVRFSDVHLATVLKSDGEQRESNQQFDRLYPVITNSIGHSVRKSPAGI